MVDIYFPSTALLPTLVLIAPVSPEHHDSLFLLPHFPAETGFAIMGNSGSVSALEKCISTVGNGRVGFAAYPSNPLYQISWVKPYNLDISVNPAAVVRPQSAQDIAGVIQCAATNNAKVQAKSGGHSYG
jgi:hypothetical protein